MKRSLKLQAGHLSCLRLNKGIFIGLLFSSISIISFAQSIPKGEMLAHYINVGQGNATLLEFSCGAVLIDAGAEGGYTKAALVRYLQRFFARRTDLNGTLDLVIITHAHIDHNFALKDVLGRYKVKNYIDNGLRYGSGKANQKWAQDNANILGMTYANYSFDQASALGNKMGIHNAITDPLNCDGIDPVITILSGRFQALPMGWTQNLSDKNGNLHSLVVKVIFGKSSFLFTGDLEDRAMEKVVELYKGTDVLDTDIWEVSHHGSNNGTTLTWLNSVTPKYAVISCGKWNSGIDAANRYNTYNYGHPRISVLDMLDSSIMEKRPVMDSVIAFKGVRDPTKYLPTKKIFCTSWDGTIVLRAFDNGIYTMIK